MLLIVRQVNGMCSVGFCGKVKVKIQNENSEVLITFFASSTDFNVELLITIHILNIFSISDETILLTDCLQLNCQFD